MSFHNTTVSDPTASQLYARAGTDFSSLNWFELQWAAWYMWIANPVIATGLMSFILHEVVYFGRCVPWVIIDSIPYFRKWKLQPAKVPTAQEQWECTKLVLFSHFTIELPQIWLFHPLAESIGMSTWQVPFPHWQTMLGQIVFFFFFEDLWHYFSHQALHYGPLYKHIHKIHHKYSAPFGLAAEYAHPAEVLILGTGTIGGPLLYCYITQNLHILTVYIWVTCRLCQAVDAHSGYDFPWSLQHWFPLWSGAEHHDFHHMAFVNNFSTSFRYLDYIFGTDDKYRAYRKKMDSTRDMTPEERKAFDLKMLAETELEGAKAEAAAEKQGELLWGKRKTVKTE